MDIIVDSFLTELIKKPVYTLVINSEINGEQVLYYLKNHIKTLPAFIQTKIHSNNIIVLWELEKIGFHLVDTNIQLKKNITSEESQSFLGVRFARPEDVKGVCKIARENFSFSRFHMDPLISNQTADLIKEMWAGNFFSGSRGDSMIVAERNEEISGFLQLIKKNQQLVIDLIAVSSNHRQRGLAKKMIYYAQNEFSSFPFMTTGTQAANKPSLTMYQKIGFHVTDAYYVLHRHLH